MNYIAYKLKEDLEDKDIECSQCKELKHELEAKKRQVAELTIFNRILKDKMPKGEDMYKGHVYIKPNDNNLIMNYDEWEDEYEFTGFLELINNGELFELTKIDNDDMRDDFDDYLNKKNKPSQIQDYVYKAAEVLFNVDRTQYEKELKEYTQKMMREENYFVYDGDYYAWSGDKQ